MNIKDKLCGQVDILKRMVPPTAAFAKQYYHSLLIGLFVLAVVLFSLYRSGIVIDPMEDENMKAIYRYASLRINKPVNNDGQQGADCLRSFFSPKDKYLPKKEPVDICSDKVAYTPVIPQPAKGAVLNGKPIPKVKLPNGHIAKGLVAEMPVAFKKDEHGRYICSVKNDKPGKSKQGKHTHIDMECCLDPDEIPNPYCYYPREKYGSLLDRYYNDKKKIFDQKVINRNKK